jgi:glycyl-tRNA synthetase beta chain
MASDGAVIASFAERRAEIARQLDAAAARPAASPSTTTPCSTK